MKTGRSCHPGRDRREGQVQRYRRPSEVPGCRSPVPVPCFILRGARTRGQLEPEGRYTSLMRSLVVVLFAGVVAADTSVPAKQGGRPQSECELPPPEHDPLEEEDPGRSVGPLSRGQLLAALRPAKHGVACCYQNYQVPGMVNVRFTVAKDGHVV